MSADAGAGAGRPLHVVLAGGGTAGHIEPALSLADALRRRDPRTEVTALGTARGLESRLVPERGYELALIPAVPVPRRPSLALLSLPGRLREAVAAVSAVLDRTSADVLVGFGGYVSAPAWRPGSSRSAGTSSLSSRRSPSRGALPWPCSRSRAGCAKPSPR